MSEPAAENLEQQMRRDLADAQAAHDQYLAELAELAAQSSARGGDREGLRPDIASGGGSRGDGPPQEQAPGPVPPADDATEPGADGQDVTGQEPAMTVLTDRSLPEAARVQVLRRLASALSRQSDYLEVLLTIAGDRQDSPAVRRAALRVLGSAAFQTVRFRPFQQRYDDLLRDLVSDPVPELRETAVSALALIHDPVVQQVLADGLSGAGELPVSRETAIRLLAEDDHLDNLPRLTEMLASPSDDARQEAVRFMGSYPEAAGLLEQALQDRTQSSGVRQQSAASLRTLAPERFEQLAKQIATDGTEEAGLRTASLTALQHLGDPEGVLADTEFVRRVEEVGADESEPDVARVARELVRRKPSP